MWGIGREGRRAQGQCWCVPRAEAGPPFDANRLPLKVKGAGQTLKQGTIIRSIRLTDNPEEIDCRHESIKGLVLRTEFVRKR